MRYPQEESKIKKVIKKSFLKIPVILASSVSLQRFWQFLFADII